MQRSTHFARGLLILLLLAGLRAGLAGPRVLEVRAAPVAAQAPSMSVIINEIAWGGTQASVNDEWIELHNPGSVDINLSGWSLQATDGTPSILLSGTIVAGGYYLLERTDDTTVSDVTADLFYSGALSNTVEVLELRDNTTAVIDTANQGGTSWYAGSAASYYSMERQGVVTDSPTAWITNVGVVRNGLDAGIPNGCTPNVNCTTNPQPINGTPRQQNWAVIVTPTATATNTATATPTVPPTSTGTGTPTSAPTPTSGPASSLDVLINEVAWAGTSGTRNSDEWIELYNTRTTAINLDGWRLTEDDGTGEADLVLFGAGDTIPAGGFYILARPASGGCTGTPDINIFTDVTEDKCFSTQLTNSTGQALRLYDAFDTLIDTANSDGGTWPAGSSSTYASMERRGKLLDSSSAWVTFAGTPFAHNRDNASVQGTPRRANWITTLTPTPVRTPTKRPTPRPPTPFGRPVISEFLPRPGFDWNQDGRIDVFDEFIEIMNIGSVAISLNGWRLDDGELIDDAGNDLSSSPYPLPNIILQPGERAVFYASETNILLSDGVDSVRLFNGSVIMDAYTYSIAKVPDQSWCRLPEGRDWYDDCRPTPNLPNTREGEVPSMPPGSGLEPPICRLPDTLPTDFLVAECHGYGANMWNSRYWDRQGWQGDQYVPANESKWQSFIE